MGLANRILPHYTYEDYSQWKDQWELIDGIPYAMSPMPRPEHQAVATNIAAEFRTALKTANCSCKVYQPIDYKVAEDTVLNPDLLIVCKPITKQFLDFTPELVAEILSPGTEPKDRYTKYHIYQEQEIPYYIIVDIDKKKVELFQLTEKEYSPVLFDAKIPYTFALGTCSFSVVFDDIWT